MSARILLLVFSFCFVPFLSRSQDGQGRSEISFGAGVQTLYKTIANDVATAGHAHFTSSGVYGINYRRSLRRRLTLGIGVAYEHLKAGAGAYTYSDKVTLINIAPEVLVSYSPSRSGKKAAWISTYGLVAFGITFVKETQGSFSPTRRIVPATLQVTPIGVRIGRAFAFYTELGMGYKGLINFGFCYRFPGSGGISTADDKDLLEN